MEELNEVNLRREMHRLTKEQGLIPDLLKVEMCLMPDAILITNASMALYDGTVCSQKYPGLKIEASHKVGWELYGSLPNTN